jgi:hypothetical protein
MIPRIICLILTVLVAGVLAKVITLGTTFNDDKPLTGWKSRAIRKVIDLAAGSMLFFGAITINRVD